VSESLYEIPLDREHRRLGAQMVPFAGFSMPIRYTSILQEHRAVRERVGLFDLSHMAPFELSGHDVATWFERLSCNRVSTMGIGVARYHLLMNERGGVHDDVILYRLADRYILIANAANADKVDEHLRSHAHGVDVRIDALHRRRVLLALQGPSAAALLSDLTPHDLTTMKSYTAVDTEIDNVPVFLARTGYTGEDGFELLLAPEHAVSVFRRLLEHGAAWGLEMAGLGARDILRLEAGMPLYGHELDEEHTPFQSGLAWAVKADKGPFLGSQALHARREEAGERLVGLILRQRIPARHGYAVFAEDRRVGAIASATIAPSVGDRSIATAFVEAGYDERGRTLSIEIRGRMYEAEVVALPFYRRHS